MYRDHPDNILGANNANNAYDSSLVASNADGSMVERLEHLRALVAALTSGAVILQDVAPAGTNSATIVVLDDLSDYGDDFFNNQWYMQILHNDNSAGNAPEKETRKIADYVSATGTFTMAAFSAAVEAGDLCLILHESQVAIGRDDADNTFDSSNVAANANGSVLERLESIQQKVGAVDAADNILGANDADNQFDSSAVVANEDGSIIERLEAIRGQVGGVDGATNPIGANDNNNEFDSALVAANEDGSILERLEQVQEAVNKGTGTPIAANKSLVDALGSDGVTVTDSAVSILGAIGANNNNNAFASDLVAANADGSVLERLEDLKARVDAVDDYVDTEVAAIEAAIGTPAADLAADIAAIKVQTDELGAAVGASISADIAAVTALIGAPAVDVAADIAAIKAQTDELGAAVGASLSADIAAVQADIGDPSARVNLQSLLALLGNPDAANQSIWNALAVAGGIAAFPVAAVPGNGAALAQVLRDIWDAVRNGTGGSEPGADRSIIDEIRGAALNYNAVNYLAVTADFTNATWNTVATHEVFTVTGLVRMRILAEVTADCTSAGGAATIKLGHEAATAEFIAATGEDDLDQYEIWFDATPTERSGNFSSLLMDKIMSGYDVGYEIEGEAFTAGSIVFHCWWESLNATGAVVAGAGGVLV